MDSNNNKQLINCDDQDVKFHYVKNFNQSLLAQYLKSSLLK